MEPEEMANLRILLSASNRELLTVNQRYGVEGAEKLNSRVAELAAGC
jgi:hypothetical protein